MDTWRSARADSPRGFAYAAGLLFPCAGGGGIDNNAASPMERHEWGLPAKEARGDRRCQWAAMETRGGGEGLHLHISAGGPEDAEEMNEHEARAGESP